MRLNTKKLKNSRDTYINWPNQIKQIVDSYLSKGASIPHATQKDGIQNCVDALNPNNKNDHKVVIRLKKIGGKYSLIIEDYGTFGLTGDVLKEEDMEKDLPKEQRWGRFENLAFNKDPDEKTLGARGQGKFMLLAASNKINFTRKSGATINSDDPPYMLYDTLREDGIYRLGIRQIQITRSPIYHFENEEAVEQLKEQTLGALDPLDHIGTRIIIPDIRNNLIKAIKTGDYNKMIAHTWFPLLKNRNELIWIDDEGVISDIKPDRRLLDIPSSDNFSTKVWKRSKSFKFNGKKRNIKLIFAAHCEDGKLAEQDVKGIAIYRSGMHVMNISHRQIPKEIMDKIYGYVEVDSSIEKELRNVEDPTHYHFDLSKGLPKKLRAYIDTEMMAFAKEKLGMHEFDEENRSRKESEARRSSLAMLNKLSKDVGFNGRGPSPPSDFYFTSEQKKDSFEIFTNRLKFPISGIKRVNTDEMLKNIACRIENNTDKKIEGTVMISAKRLKNRIVTILNETITIDPRENWKSDIQDLLINKKQFKTPGRYAMVYQFKPVTENLSLKVRKLPFWVNMNPNVQGIFKDLIPADFTGTDKEDLTGYPIQESGDWIFYYNTGHNAYKAYPDPEKDLEYHIAMITPPWFAYIDTFENDHEERKLMTREAKTTEEIIWETCRVVGKIQSMLTGGD